MYTTLYIWLGRKNLHTVNWIFSSELIGYDAVILKCGTQSLKREKEKALSDCQMFCVSMNVANARWTYLHGLDLARLVDTDNTTHM